MPNPGLRRTTTQEWAGLPCVLHLAGDQAATQCASGCVITIAHNSECMCLVDTCCPVCCVSTLCGHGCATLQGVGMSGGQSLGCTPPAGHVPCLGGMAGHVPCMGDIVYYKEAIIVVKNSSKLILLKQKTDLEKKELKFFDGYYKWVISQCLDQPGYFYNSGTSQNLLVVDFDYIHCLQIE